MPNPSLCADRMQTTDFRRYVKHTHCTVDWFRVLYTDRKYAITVKHKTYTLLLFNVLVE